MRKFKENLKNSRRFLRQISKETWKFLISFQKMLKYFEKVLRKYKNAKEIWNHLFKISENYKIIWDNFAKNIRKFF